MTSTFPGANPRPFVSPPSPDMQPNIGPVEAFWRFRKWTVPVTIGIGLLAAIAAFSASSSSTASTTLFLSDPRGNPVFSNSSTSTDELARYARQRAEFAQSVEAFDAVIASIEAERADDPTIQPETPDTLEDIVDATPTASSNLQVECTDSDPERAERVCRTVAQTYIELTAADTDRQADEQVAALQRERDRLNDEDVSSLAEIDGLIGEVRREAVLFGGGVEFIEPAEVEANSRIAPAIQFGLAGLLFAAFVAAAIAWFRAARWPLIGSGGEATLALRAPLLGEVVHAPPVAFAAATPPGPAYQLLATSLNAVHPEGGIVLAGGPTASINAPETIARMATASAREGRRVLVVDSDIEDGAVSSLFGVTKTTGGLTDLLSGNIEFAHAQRTIGVGGDAWLDLITGGRPIDDPSSLIRSQQGREAIASFRADYDLVLVAIAPLLTAADGAAFASAADGVIMIVDRGASTRDLSAVRQRLDVLRTPILGVVFDHRPGDHDR